MNSQTSNGGGSFRIWRSLFLTPKGCGALYALSIFAFATLYSYLKENNFYHANAAIEPAYFESKALFFQSLRNDLFGRATNEWAGIIRLYPNQKWPLPQWDSLAVVESDMSQGKATFTVHLDVQTGQPNLSRPTTSRYAFRATMREVADPKSNSTRGHVIFSAERIEELKPPFSTVEWSSQIMLAILAFQAESSEFDPSVHGLFSAVEFANAEGIQVLVGHSTYTRWCECQSALRGQPIGGGGLINSRLARMLYFSVVTIATLGYGDIVPLSALARLLVAVEAVWGIFVAGLFINAFFTRHSNSSS